jgi:spore coat polysaccharide biosynthesis protein SpsF
MAFEANDTGSRMNQIRCGIIVACRMSSQRLPGKTLLEVCGKPLLWYVIARLQSLRTSCPIVVACTDEWFDDPIAAYCHETQVPVFRGSTTDVAGRLVRCAQQYGFDYFARVNGDSPFVCPALLRQGFDLAMREELELTTNLAPRSFPYGVAVEIIKTSWFAEQHARMSPEEKEHVTLGFYSRIQQIRFQNIFHQYDYSGVRLTIDTEVDLARFRRLMTMYGAQWPHVSYEQVAMTLTSARSAA